MNRQSQQLVVAGVVAFLTSGIITLAGLSAAQDPGMAPMPPGDMGGPQPMMDQGNMMEPQPPMDMGGSPPFQPMNDYPPIDDYRPEDTQRPEFGDMKRDFPRDGGFPNDDPVFHRNDMDFPKDGPRFDRPDSRLGDPDFGGKTGGDRRFRDDSDQRKPMGDTQRFGEPKRPPFRMSGDEGGGDKQKFFGGDTQRPVMHGVSEERPSFFGGPQTKPPADIGKLVDNVGDFDSGELPKDVLAKVANAVAKLSKACDKMLTNANKLETRVLKDDTITSKEVKQIAKLGGNAEKLLDRVDAIAEVFDGDYDLPDALVQKYEAAQENANAALEILGGLYEEARG